jgi:RNA-directed DNA polymerase
VNSDEKIMGLPGKVKYKWDEINCRKLEKIVFKLQKRIYQASKSVDWKRVKRLQKLLLSSNSAKLLAVRRVTQVNKGKGTAGIDGVKSLSPDQRRKLSNELNLGERSKPSRRVWIPKPGKSEERPLGIPTMSDRAKQALVKLALEPEWEAKFEPNSYGFRPARSCQDAIEAIHIAINKKNVYVLDADIKGCFDNIDHTALLKKLNTFPKLRRVIKGWLRSGVIEKNVFHETEAGTPQGGVISPLLANVALHGLEYETRKAVSSDIFRYMKETRGVANHKDAQQKFGVIRYADDFIIIHESKEIIMKAKQFVERWLEQIGLKLSETKTRIVHTLKSENGIECGFDFLGFSIKQYHSKIRDRKYVTHIKPSKDSQKKHKESVSEILKHKVSGSQKGIIDDINPVIRGWSNYYRSVVSGKVFNKMDHYVYEKLWKLTCKRHPSKGLRWIKQKYFRGYKGDTWRFSTPNGFRLLHHSEIHIKRHVKVRGTRTPYDGDLQYCSKRLNKKLSINDLAMRCVGQTPSY